MLNLLGRGLLICPHDVSQDCLLSLHQLFTVISGALYQILHQPPRSETTEEQLLRANKDRAAVIMAASK